MAQDAFTIEGYEEQMTAAKQTHTTGNLCQGSFSLEGSGPLQ